MLTAHEPCRSSSPFGAPDAWASGSPKGRVLIVEEDRHSLERYADAFLERGFAIAAACDEAGALRALGGGPFDVVLAGAGPADDSLLNAIRARSECLPVVLVRDLPVAGAERADEAGLVHRLRRTVATEEVVRCAERAARRARAAAAGGGPLDAAQVEAAARERAASEALFARAVGSLFMTYQPILRTRDGSIFGWEALLRTGESGVKGPLEFLDLAERLGELSQLGQRIRSSVARTARRTRGVMFFVNLHADDLIDEGLFERSAPLSSFAPDVVLEITERSPIERVPGLHDRVRRLRELGFRLAIDDLGSGHARLASFASLAPDFVKLDRHIIHGLDRDPVRRDFVESVVSLSHDMGTPVVAEGIETESEQQVATELGCDLMQGFLFRRPEELAIDSRFRLSDAGWASCP